jgi:hypothetical protein
MKNKTLDISLFLTPGFGVELERQLRRTYPGQAHFAGTGPVGARCEHCCHLGYWRQHRNAAGAITYVQRVGGCAKFYALTGNHGAVVPPSAEACRHFEARTYSGDENMSAYSDKIAKQKQQGFFRTADVENGEITHTIAYLLEDMVVFDDKKDVLVFTDTGRQLPLNVTNAEVLINSFGDEPHAWAGKRVTMYLGQYGKDRKPCLRLKAAAGNGAATHQAGTASLSSDEIPF